MAHCVGMPFECWPARDRELWTAATATGADFDSSSMAQWKPSTLKTAAGAYGIWLEWLQAKGLLADPDPASRLSVVNIKAFIKAEMARGISITTIADRAHRIISVVSGMRIGVDTTDVRRVANRAEKAAHRQWRPHGEIVHASVLYRIGLDLAQKAELVGLRTREGAGLYIDGLVIALLAACPTRISAFCSLRLDHEMVRDSENWQMLIPGENTKTNIMETRFIPPELTDLVDDYVQVVRPYLLAGRPQPYTDCFFVGLSGIPLQDQVMRKRIVRRTEVATGKRILPHDFRKCAVTTLVLEQPRHAPSAPLLLSHTGTRTAEKHYIMRQQMLALEHYHEALGKVAVPKAKAVGEAL